jgi:phosphate transport system permease protein
MEYATSRPFEQDRALSLTRRGGSFSADTVLSALTTGSAFIVMLMLAALVVVLAHAAMPSIREFGGKFLISSEWRPNALDVPKRDAKGRVIIEDGEVVVDTVPPAFGALPVIFGTIVSSTIALVLAVPLSFGVALFLIRIAPSASGLAIKMTVALVLVFLSTVLFGRRQGVSLPVLLLAFLPFAVLGALAIGWANTHGKLGHEVLKVVFDVLIAVLTIPFTAMIFVGIMRLGMLGYGLSVVFGILAGLGSALYARRVGEMASFLVEFLAAIPSIAYGMWGLFILAPFLQSYLEKNLGHLYIALGRPSVLHWLFQETRNGKMRDLPLTGRDMFCGGVVLAIMIVPIIAAIARDVLRSVPRAQVEATVALGATWWQTSKEMLRYSRAGLFGAVMLGLARAAGETMAVTMVIGNNNQIRASLFAPAQTMSSLLANEFSEATSELHRSALSEVALILLVMSLIFNVVARYLVVGKSSRSAAGH